MAPRTVLDLSSKLRRSVGRFFLIMGMVGPGILLIFFHTWANNVALIEVQHVPHSLFGLGILLLFGSILAIPSKSRDFGYICGAVFYVIILTGAIFSLFSDNHVSALAFMIPIVTWIYAESAITASRSQENTKNKNMPRG